MAQMTIQHAFDLALRHHQSGRLHEAEQIYRQILAQNPNHAEALHMMGVIAAQVGRNDIAVDLIRRALVVKPNWPEAYNNLGNAFKHAGQLDQAVAAYRQAIAINPSYPEAHCNLGNAFKDSGQLDLAIAAYRQAIAIKPNLPEIHSNLGNALRDTGQLDEAIAAYREALAINPNLPETHSNLIYAIHYHPGCSAQAIAEEHRCWNRQHAEPLRRFIQPHTNDPSPERRLRIGYVSPDFRNHPAGRFLMPLWQHHDHAGFEIFAYAQLLTPDAFTERLRSHTNHWRSIVGLSDEQAASQIRQDGIDILIDLAGHTANNRLRLFARKPAPVQVTWLGFPGTSGLEAIDYRFTDPFLEPQEGNDQYSSEKPIRLPDTAICYQSISASPEVGPLPALATGRITFGCLNNPCKVTEPAMALWAKVMHAVPASDLLLYAHEGDTRQRMRDLLAGYGIDRDRIDFVGHGGPRYLGFFHRIDVCLDPFPYNGSTTTCDSAWMGVPVVSLAGRTVCSRMGLSALSNIGVPELVAGTPEEYVRIAVELASDLPRLKELRSTLRKRMDQSPLMDAAKFTRGVESAYREMWRRWCEGTGESHFPHINA